MNTLHLLVEHDRNRELLAETYAVTSGTDAVTDETDMCIVGQRGFPENRERLEAWKTAHRLLFSTVVLVSEETPGEKLDPDPQETSDGLYVIDEILSVPIEETVLYRRLENLFRNAVEHGATSPNSRARQNAVEHGGDEVRITVGALADRSTGGFYVADDGPGIPTDQHEQVLERGYSTQDDGTGFDPDIVEAHGWEMESRRATAAVGRSSSPRSKSERSPTRSHDR